MADETVPSIDLLPFSPQEFATAGLAGVRQRANYVSTVIDANGGMKSGQNDLLSETVLDLIEYGVRSWLLDQGHIDHDPARSPWAALSQVEPELHKTTWRFVMRAGEPDTDLPALAREVMDFNETVMQADIADHWWGFEMSEGFLDRIFEQDFGPMILLAEYLGIKGQIPDSFIQETHDREERIRALDDV